MALARALAPEPIYFLYRTPGVREILVGALVPSSDSVGRSFPLAIYGFVDGALVVIERATRDGEPAWPPNFEPMRVKHYGETALHWAEYVTQPS